MRQYISLLERGYRVFLERQGDVFSLVLHPDGSTPRLGLRGAHSVVSHRDGRVYTNTTDNRVAVIDASTRQVKKYIRTGDDPSHLELSHDGNRLYIANSGSNDATIVDTINDQVIATAATGKRPLLPCVAADGNAVYLPSGPDRSVTVLGGAGEFRAKVPVGNAPHDIAVSPDSRWAFQPNSASHTVTVIDGRDYSVVGEIKVGLGPGHIAFDPESRFAYVANTVSDDVTVICTSNHDVVATIPAGKGAHLPALSPDGRFGYVANFASDDLTVWDCQDHRVIATHSGRYLSALFRAQPGWKVVGRFEHRRIEHLHHRRARARNTSTSSSRRRPGAYRVQS